MLKRLLQNFLQLFFCYGGPSARPLPSDDSPLIRGVELDIARPQYGTPAADLYKGRWEKQIVAAKRERIFEEQDRQRLYPEIMEAAKTFSTLRHDNILPFYGIDNQVLSPFLCLITQWVENGDALHYLSSADHLKSSITPMLLDVARGLEYLHSKNVVHGSVRASNVLIGKKGNAVLTDYGIAGFVDEITAGMALPGNPNVRFFAPELHDPERFGLERSVRTVETDIFSFAMLAVQLYTRKAPFKDIRHDNSVIFATLDGRRPQRPTTIDCPGDVPSDAVWELIARCWAQAPSDRPTARAIVTALQNIS